MSRFHRKLNPSSSLRPSLHSKDSDLKVKKPEPERQTKIFPQEKDHVQYWLVFSILLILALVFAYGLLTYNNPVLPSNPSYFPLVKRRIFAILTILIVTICQSLATISFQSVTGNRIITPSLLGFDSIYATIHTATIFFFGTKALTEFTGVGPFLLQVLLMVGFCLLLFGTLLKGRDKDLQFMLLVGIVLGGGLRSLSSFMRRLLSPSEFDVLQAKLFGSVNHAKAEYFPIVIPLVLLCLVLFFIYSPKLNLLALGDDTSTKLGLNPQRGTKVVLTLVSVLMAVSTALMGSLNFFGFLVATLTYEVVKSYDHRALFLMSLVLGFCLLSGSYFIMYHIFNAQGVVSIILEMVGGLAFLILFFKKEQP